MTEKVYRPHIDGLRAIAVMVVVLFHFGFDAFSGGYVGVDVFFVISGYLITGLIVAQIEQGRFTFADFYLRRARRLLPALLFTLVLSCIFAFLLFSPEHLERFFGAVAYALLSVSNFYFWDEAGYFNASASIKPLLHTWSLSVEEQFYVLWPCTLVLLVKKAPKWVAPTVVCGLGLGSLYLAERWLISDSAAAFFLLPSRIFEFAIGATLVWLMKCQPRQGLWLEAVFIAGLSLILAPVFLYKEHTSFPGLAALVPCLGTGFVIYAGSASHLAAVLRHRLMVYLGLISYSLYLIHWPIFVFYNHYFFGRFEAMDGIGLTVVSIAAAALMYRYVERPFRFGSANRERWLSNRGFVAAGATSVALIFTIAVTGWTSGGLKWRVSASIAQAVEVTYKKYHRKCERKIAALDVYSTCVVNENADGDVYILGDSHAKSLFNGFAHMKDTLDARVNLVASNGIIPFYGTNTFINARQREHRFDQAIDYVIAQRPDTVILHARFALVWHTFRPAGEGTSRRFLLLEGSSASRSTESSQGAFKAGLEMTLARLSQAGINSVVIGAVPHLGTDLNQCMMRPTYVSTADANHRDCPLLSFDEASQRAHAVNRTIREITARFDQVAFVDPLPLFCTSREKGVCDTRDEVGLYYRDDDHLSPYGAAKLIQANTEVLL